MIEIGFKQVCSLDDDFRISFQLSNIMHFHIKAKRRKKTLCSWVNGASRATSRERAGVMFTRNNYNYRLLELYEIWDENGLI